MTNTGIEFSRQDSENTVLVMVTRQQIFPVSNTVAIFIETDLPACTYIGC